jgi:uncharacterized protein
MKSAALLIASLLGAYPAVAQTSGAPAKPPARHQPGVVAPKSAPADAPSPSSSTIDPAKQTAIRKLMEVTGSAKIGDQLIGNATVQVRNIVGPKIPQDKLQRFMDTFDQNLKQRVSPDQVENAIVPIYANHFSLDEIEGITQFYESPLGQRVVQNLPDVFRESQTVSQQMIQKSAIETLRGMSDDYPELKQMLPPDGASAAPGAERPAQPEGQPPHLSQPPQTPSKPPQR